LSEHKEQVALFDFIRLNEERFPILKTVFAIPNGGHRHIKVAKKMKDEGVIAGVWDIFVATAVNEYCGLFIEMKFGKNKLSENQEEFRENVGNAYRWEVCYSWVEAAKVLIDYLCLPKDLLQ